MGSSVPYSIEVAHAESIFFFPLYTFSYLLYTLQTVWSRTSIFSIKSSAFRKLLKEYSSPDEIEQREWIEGSTFFSLPPILGYVATNSPVSISNKCVPVDQDERMRETRDPY